MKIKEITLKENYKIASIDPTKGAELVDPNNPDLKITMPLNQLQPDQTDPSKYTIAAAVPGQPAQSPEGVAPTGQIAQQPATAEQPVPFAQNSTTQPPANGQQPTQQPAYGQQPANGQQTAQSTTQQPTNGQQPPKPPQVGAEIKLAEKFNDRDLINSKHNDPIGGRNGGDKTDDFIDDVTDHNFEKHAGKSNRKEKHTRVHESEELIAMLTIAGLR